MLPHQSQDLSISNAGGEFSVKPVQSAVETETLQEYFFFSLIYHMGQGHVGILTQM